VTLIKCPQCGQTVLSVASACPRCSSPLRSARFPQSWEGTLTECRQCGNPISSGVIACPYCGVRRPATRRARTFAVAAVTLVLVGAVTARAVMPHHASRPAPADSSAERASGPTEPAALGRVTPNPSPKEPAPALAKAADTVPVATVPLPAPESVIVNLPSIENPAPKAAVPSPQPDTAARREARWARVYANVRASPTETATIVRVLKPGQRIEVSGGPIGWSLVYVDGQRAGYVGSVLLSHQPPGP